MTYHHQLRDHRADRGGVPVHGADRRVGIATDVADTIADIDSRITALSGTYATTAGLYYGTPGGGAATATLAVGALVSAADACRP